MRRSVLPLLLVLLLLAGCVTPAALQPASVSPLAAGGFGPVKLRAEGGFEMSVPIHVYLVGFDAAVAPALQAKLAPLPVDHSPMTYARAFPDVTASETTAGRAPTQPTADFHVHDAGAAVTDAFLKAAPEWKIQEGKYDANKAEAFLADALAASGVTLDRSNPVFVIVHAGTALPKHGWRHTFAHGSIDNVRIFGELEPLTIFDASAQPDPYVVGGGPTKPLFDAVFGAGAVEDYDYPVDASGAKTVDALAHLARDAVQFRFLKGPIYPIATNACHHVTLLLGVETTSLGETLPGFTRAKDLVHVDALKGAWTNLTGGDVRVDLKVMTLPQDDPVLDALLRGGGTATLDELRWYFDTNFDKFVKKQAGCEEYLSALVVGDPTTTGALYSGIGTYDVKRSHRISFSIVNDLARKESPTQGSSPTREWDMIELLYAHETGHLFGQHHPQHLTDTKDNVKANSAFEGVYSVMAYQQNDKNTDFGAVDFATWTRGRVGYSIAEAQKLGLEGTPEFAQALALLEKGDWLAAHNALEPKLAAAAAAQPGKLDAYDFSNWHVEPWAPGGAAAP